MAVEDFGVNMKGSVKELQGGTIDSIKIVNGGTGYSQGDYLTLNNSNALQTDGYSGCPGIGIKRATTIFENKGYSWKTVVEAFEEKGFTESDALVNARLARILTVDDYDFKKKKPRLWNPASDYKIND